MTTTRPKPNGSYQVQVKAAGTNNVGADYTRLAGRSFALYENGDPNPDVDGDGMPNLYEGYHPCLKAQDPSDAGTDPDGDGLESKREWDAGTDPCSADTDLGGEPDGSELKRGANPFDATDDALPRPEGAAVIDQVVDHLPRPAFKPKSLLIRYPANPSYDRIRLLRATSPNGPFTLARSFDSTAKGGQVRDTGLTNDTTYYYQVVAIDFAGNRSVPSPAFSGTPHKDPMPPIGSVQIDEGRTYAETAAVNLGLKVDDGDVTEMMVSNDGTFAGAAWQPFAASLAWNLEPGATGFATVFVKFRDAGRQRVQRGHGRDPRPARTGLAVRDGPARQAPAGQEAGRHLDVGRRTSGAADRPDRQDRGVHVHRPAEWGDLLRGRAGRGLPDQEEGDAGPEHRDAGARGHSLNDSRSSSAAA